MRTRIAIFLACLGLFLQTPRVQADTTSEYDGFVRRAVEEFEQGHWDEAHALFRRAHEISPSARTWRGLGITAYEARQYVRAVAALEAALADPHKALTDSQREEVTSVLARAREFTATFHIERAPQDAVLTVDGESVLLEDQTLLLDPGEHVLRVTAPGHAPEELRLRAEAGEQQTLRLSLRPDDAPKPGAVEPPSAPARRRRLRATWVLGGLTVGAGAATLGVGLATRAKHDDFATCRRADPALCGAVADRGERLQLLTNVGIGLAGALAAGTVIGFFVERRGIERTVVLMPGPRGLALRGRF